MVLAAILLGLSCRQAAIRFGVSASSAIRCRTMERVQGDATPKAFVARPALDARGPSCAHPFARCSMRPRTSRSKSSGRHQIMRKKDRARHRAGSPGHREAPRAWFNGQLESRSRPPCVQHRTLDLEQHLPSLRMGAEMARGSESAFLMCTPKQRPSSPDCTLTEWSPRWFWTDPPTAPP